MSHRTARWSMAAMACIVPLALASCSSAGEEAPAAGATPAEGSCDFASDYPKGPVELIVPWAAGGGTDAVGRQVANSLAEQMGVQVNVVNRTGGAGVIGHQAIQTAKPDGQTIGLATAELAMMHWQGLTPMTFEDFTAVSLVNSDHSAVTVKADSEWQDIKSLLEYIKAHPGELKASGTAQGGIGHLGMIGMLLAYGLPEDSVTWVPSDGAAPALQEVVGGGVDFIVTSSPAEVKTMLDAGEVTSLAVLNDTADPNFTDIPTFKDGAGVDYTFGTWRGIVGPKGVDQPIVDELQCYLAVTAEEPEFTSLMATSGFGIDYLDSAAFATFLSEQDAQMNDVMAAAGLKS